MNEAQDVLDGFNAGYIIQKHRPDVFKQLQDSLQEVELPFFTSFIAGGREYTQEKNLADLRSLRENRNSRDYDKEGLDKDYI